MIPHPTRLARHRRLVMHTEAATYYARRTGSEGMTQPSTAPTAPSITQPLIDEPQPESDTVGSVLQIELCDDSGWVLAEGESRSCEWLNANESRLVARLGFDAS